MEIPVPLPVPLDVIMVVRLLVRGHVLLFVLELAIRFVKITVQSIHALVPVLKTV